MRPAKFLTHESLSFSLYASKVKSGLEPAYEIREALVAISFVTAIRGFGVTTTQIHPFYLQFHLWTDSFGADLPCFPGIYAVDLVTFV